MEDTVFVENPGPGVMFVAGRMVPPGEGRHIARSALVAEAAAPADAPPVDADAPLRALLEGSVATITAQLSGLTQEALDRLAELEAEREHPRKTLVEALEAEKLKRAEEALEDQKAAAAEAAAKAAAEAAAQAGDTDADAK